MHEEEYVALYGALEPRYLTSRDELLAKGTSEDELLQELFQCIHAKARNRPSPWVQSEPTPSGQGAQTPVTSAAAPATGAPADLSAVSCPAPAVASAVPLLFVGPPAPTLASPITTRPRAALCLSGGGIRSATFSLGVLQGLAKCKLLQHFDYLSTVSGGGYVGGWLSAWLHRDPTGAEGVHGKLTASVKRDDAECAKCAESDSQRGCDDADAPNSNPEPAQIRHLRQYSNYLTPAVGLFRPDGWTLVASYGRNLLLNWLVLVPLIAVCMTVPHVYSSLLAWLSLEKITIQDGQVLSARDRWIHYVGLGATAVPLLLALVGMIMGLPSLNTARADRPPAADSDGNPDRLRPDARHKPMQTNQVLIYIVFPIFISCVATSLLWAKFHPVLGPAERLGRTSVFCVAFYALAALIGWALTRIYRKPNAPPLFRLVVTLVIAGTITGVAAFGLRMLPLFRSGELDVKGSITGLEHHIYMYACLAVPSLLGLHLLLITLYVGLTSSRPAGDDDREWLARAGAWLLMIQVFWLGSNALALGAPDLVRQVFSASAWTKGLSAAISLIATVAGLVGSHTLSSTGRADRPAKTVGSALLRIIPSVAAPIAVCSIFLFMSAALDSGIDLIVGEPGTKNPTVVEFLTELRLEFWPMLILAMVLLFVGVLCGRVINSNRLSLHAVYRDRIIRAFLGASSARREADPFTGFDPQDNVPVHHLRRPKFFTARDLEDDNPPGCHKHWRLVGVARMLLEQRTPFMTELWKLSYEQIPLLNALRDELPPRDRDRDKYGGEPIPPGFSDRALEPVLAVLNNAVQCRGLVFKNQRYSDWGGRAAVPEIAAAFDRLQDDGCSTLLNRLILEEEFCELPPVAEVGKAGGKAPKSDLLCYLKRTRHAQVTRPLHVINVALNLVETQNLAWQQRKAESFTISPLHCGFHKGYRPSVDYGGSISLGTALTISGAAATPNMGYHSSPAVTFLMTLFNVRLGWWLGNPSIASEHWWSKALRMVGLQLAPRPKRDQAYRRRDPHHSFVPLINEALGRTTDRYEYVYLSDGGHFENLGLYEMVRRRCHHVVVVDASCDPDGNFEDIGNAVRKVRIDLGIPITLHEVKFYPSSSLKKGKFCAVGTIEYRAVDGAEAPDGTLVYIKAARHRLEPVDVFNHGQTYRKFPHDPTSHQWFNESQFESYRELGAFTIESIFEDALQSVNEALQNGNAKNGKDAGTSVPNSHLLIRALHALEEPKDLYALELAARVHESGVAAIDRAAVGERAPKEAQGSGKNLPGQAIVPSEESAGAGPAPTNVDQPPLVTAATAATAAQRARTRKTVHH
jgi:hypothetical protein